MNRLFATIGVVVAVAAAGSAMARTPAAYGDSESAAIDTRVGNVDVIENQTLDSRVGSWDASSAGALDTFNSPGICILIR